ncbi:unnamed protein product [Cuscuta europaea]|uniref:J domain-containing protein n=1 Tax=Cuscuta europaea TaxID=41803 RepID=A0A9P1EGN8_CUSEU|nr:unnamed protein product [Cuscuta europaea]
MWRESSTRHSFTLTYNYNNPSGADSGDSAAGFRAVFSLILLRIHFSVRALLIVLMGNKKNRRRASKKNLEEEECEEPNQYHESAEAGSSSNEKSLYEILGVEKSASQQEIKKAYHRLALRLHPDKNPDNEEAKEKFQELQKVMSVLGDEDKRAVYDQTGCIDDADLAEDFAQNLKQFLKSMLKEVTEADIEEFAANYRGSDSEKKDLIDLYTKYKGNMNRLFCSMLCSDPNLDSHRFKDVIDEAIASGDLKSTKAYNKWAKKVSERKPPTSPLRKKNKQKAKKESDDLSAIIAQRQRERRGKMNSLFSSVISKYGGDAPEPSEEEFEAARQKLERKMKKSKLK